MWHDFPTASRSVGLEYVCIVTPTMYHVYFGMTVFMRGPCTSRNDGKKQALEAVCSHLTQRLGELDLKVTPTCTH